MKTKLSKRILSLFIAVIMAVTGLIPAFHAFAADGVEGYYDIELFYQETDTIVPSYGEPNADGEQTEYIEYMAEGDELPLTYKLIDTEFPDNGYVKWYSETPTLVDVTQEGVVKAFDSSKGAVIHSWIDNEVKTIPLVGSLIAQGIEKVIFNDYVNVDTMDTDAIVALVESAFGEDSILDRYIESYKGELINSLREYLDNINSNIHVVLYAADGAFLAEDVVRICVTKNEEWYANFLPNGTHITNKSQINTTVAVGSKVQLYAVTTPVRLKYGVVYSVKSTSVFDTGKVIATVDDSGLVTFKNKGTVTIMVSPDSEQVIQGILEMINYIYKLENTGTINTDKVADILIKYIGIDMNRTVLAAILDICFAIKDIAGDAADPVQLTATAVEIIANLVLQFVYNDTITFNVVDSQPITNFDIEGPASVREGTQIKMDIVNVEPSVGDTSDITWYSSDPSIASVDPVTGVITGRDAGGSLGSLSSQKCVIYAVSAANHVEKSVNLTVTGKTGKYLSDVEIIGKQYLEMGQETDYSFTVYPKRVAESNNLYISWGIADGVDENDEPKYIWATADEPATDGIGTIDTMGHYVVTSGGNCTIAVKATTGYYLSNGNFYEISSYIGTLDITNGIPVESISIRPVSSASKQDIDVKTANVDGEEHIYGTVYIGVGNAYNGKGAVIAADIYPANATNQNVKWVVDNSHYSNEVSNDTHSVTVTQKAGHEVADKFNIYAVSADGDIVSNVVTVCVTRNQATSNKIDQSKIDAINGKTVNATHTMTFDGSWTGGAYACYDANWYSSDESVFTVVNKNNDNSDAVIYANDVGKATLYCVSGDGGIVDSCQVTVFPDKEYLRNIVNICDRTVIQRTAENMADYKDYMGKLDLAYYVLYDEAMASQTICDTTASNLLYAFYKIGGFIGIGKVDIMGQNMSDLSSNYITVNVGSTSNYKNYSYDLDFKVTPADAMYSNVEWTSSDSSVSVNSNGVCKPTSNNACAAMITCTLTDYMGTQTSDSVFVAFSRTRATGVSLDTTSIDGGRIGETQTLKATVSPTPTLGIGGASCTNVYWSSSDESIATVDQNGVVTFVQGGDCIITCTTMDGGHKAECKVNVVTNYGPLSLLINQYRDLQLNEINYYPDTWEYFQDTLAQAADMVAKGGYSQAEVDKMYSKLEESYNSLKKYNYIQKIELYLDGEATKEFYQYDLSVLKEGISYKNAVLDLNVRIYPNNGSYGSVKWESSTTDISVTNDGKCTPTANKSCYGLITCTVTDHYGNEFTDTVWVSYSFVPVTELTLSDTNISGPIGATYPLSCTVHPTGTSLLHILPASIQDYYWESDNNNIATVDQNGVVTFVNAGATVVRAVSYDGGIFAECTVSSEGDRSVLLSALETYKDTDYRDYEYSYGLEFREAYAQAEQALTDNTLSQQGIDAAANRLLAAGEVLASHPYIHVDSFNLSYKSYGLKSETGSGTVSSNDALSVKLSSSYASYSNYVEITAGALPSTSMYQSLTWSVDSTTNMNSSINGNVIKLTPSSAFTTGGVAVVTVIATDHYGASVSRTITVVMSRNTCSGINISPSEVTLYPTSEPYQVNASLSGSPEFKDIRWSSSDSNVAKVDGSGVVTPVDKGQATITAKTVDGGYTATVKVTVLTDFSVLASKQNEYSNFIESVKETYEYTQDSLDVLFAAVSDAKVMIDEGKATQAEVNNMVSRLDNAYNSLVKYIISTGLSIDVDGEQDGVTQPNPGFIRYSGTAISAKSIKLTAVLQPQNSFYETMEWSSSNPEVLVEDDGKVINDSFSSQVSMITCTITTVKGDTYSASAYVSFVRSGAASISFNEEMVFGAPQQTVALNPVIKNANSSVTGVIKDCIYTSDDPEIASVDENGVVTFNTQGTATITAVTMDGGYSATIQAYTTWDTTALKSAMDTAETIDYMDYAYEYGTAFKAAYDAAVEVYSNVYASQDEIDSACTVLTEAMSLLEGNEFVSPEIDITRDGVSVANNSIQQIDSNEQVVISKLINEGAMYKSATWSIEDSQGAQATEDENGNLVITKDVERASITVKLTVIDDYGREISKTITFNVIAQIILATSIALTADGEAVTGNIVHSCGGSYTKFNGIQLGYIPTPENSNTIESVSYTSSATTYITVSNDGLIQVTAAGRLRSSNTAIITCTVTNIDGTKVTASVNVTITRA